MNITLITVFVSAFVYFSCLNTHYYIILQYKAMCSDGFCQYSINMNVSTPINLLVVAKLQLPGICQ